MAKTLINTINNQKIFIETFAFQEIEHVVDYKHFLELSKFSRVFGLDPGSKHMGFTCISAKRIVSYEIEFPSSRKPDERMEMIFNAMDYVTQYTYAGTNRILMAIEGSSFSSPYRNTELAEARILAAAYVHLFLGKSFAPTYLFIPPLSVRKLLFGSSKITAESVWKDQLKPNAASSLAVAMAGILLGGRE